MRRHPAHPRHVDHRTTRVLTRYFPPGFTVDLQHGIDHYHIKTPSGAVNWWPGRGRWHMPHEKLSTIGTEKKLINQLWDYYDALTEPSDAS